MIKEVVNYYKESLILDNLLKLNIKEENLLYGDKDIPQKYDYIAYGIGNHFARDKFLEYIENTIELYKQNENNEKSNTVLEYPHDYMYAPFFIHKKSIDKNKKEIILNYPLFLIHVSHENILQLINTVHSNEASYQLFNEAFSFHPFSVVNKFDCIPQDLLTQFLLKLRLQSMNEGAQNFEQLLYKMSVFVESLTQTNVEYQHNDTRTILERNKELICSLQQFYTSSQLYKDIIVRDEPWIIVKKKEDTDFTKGLINVYSSIEKQGLSSNNLLSKIIQGNKYQRTSVPFDKEENDESSIILTKELLAKCLGKQKGAFAKDFDLTFSQRYALAMAKQNFDVTPVNGPPGTGKTSLLRALIADITVENALKVYGAYEKKEKSLPFPTPIVSFSTNNKALENIVEGINDAYHSTFEIAKTENPETANLYKRWINLSFAYYLPNQERKETKINDAKLFVPFIKNGQFVDITNPKAPLFHFSIKKQYGLKQFTFELNKNLINYVNMWLVEYIQYTSKSSTITKEYAKLHPINALDTAINDLAKQIKLNNTEIEMMTQQLLDFAQIRQNCEPDVEQLYRSLDIEIFGPIQNKNTLEVSLLKAKAQIKYLQENLNIYKEHVNSKRLALSTALNEKDKYLTTEIEKINNLAYSDLKKAHDENQIEFEKIEQHYNLLISSITRQIDAIRIQLKATFLGRVKDFLAEKYNIELFMNQQIKELKLLINEYENECSANIESLKEKLTDTINMIETARANHVNSMQIETKKIKKLLNQSFTSEKITIMKNFLAATCYEEFEQVEKIIKIANELIKKIQITNYFFYEDFELEFMTKFKNIDKTVRTTNFFLATHLLEGLLLSEFMRRQNIALRKETQCFCCNKNTLTRKNNSDEKASYHCQSCGARFINNKIKGLGRQLSETEIKNLLVHGFVAINELIYVLTEGTTKPFWNITTGFTKNIEDVEQNFRYTSVFFPIVNTTCHSFGGVFNITEDNLVPPGFIDTLFMDESGMILIPYLVNLYAGKKVILFGDEKQIRPVYQFGEYAQICNNLLLDICTTNTETQNLILSELSVTNKNAMNLANRAVYFKNQYDTNLLPGDLWLKEHFRCKSPIIEFCNKYIYDNLMILCNPSQDQKRHLVHINHEYKHTKAISGQTNDEEARIILQEINKYINEEHEKAGKNKKDLLKTIGIITPYGEQEEIFRKLVKDYNLQGLAYGTVHKFQGSERAIIHFSSTVGPNTENVGSLFFNTDNFNIINVAVSRAKEKFILYGNLSQINAAPTSYIGLLAEHIEKNGQIIK